ncbi:MAG: YfhO family protein [Anaerolineae bacterium]
MDKARVEEPEKRHGGRVRARLPDLLALAALAALVVIFFAPILFLPDRWMPAGGGDLSGFMYPYIRYATETLRTLHVPLWNPYLYSGAPFLADIQSSVFYPATLLLALLPIQVTYRELELLSVFHFWWAGAAMYITLRAWYRPALARPAALFGAAAFALSDVFFTHFGNLNLIASASWLPLVLLGVRIGGPGGILLGAGALALSALAGHTQPPVMILLAVGVYGLLAIIDWLARRLRPGSAVADTGASLSRTLLAVIAIPVLGLGMAAVVLLPAFELTQLTRRVGLSYAEAAAFSLPVQALIDIVAPHLHGRGPAGFWASWPRVEVGYLGVFPLLLAVVGLTRRRGAVFWVVLTALALLLALGPATPLHGLFYQWVPGMAQLRAPARLMLLADFGIAGLAALGFDTLLRRPRPALGWAAAAVAGVLAVALLIAYTQLGAAGKPNAAQASLARTALWAGLALLAVDAAVILLGAYRRLSNAALIAVVLGLLAVDLVGQGIGVDVGREDPTANYDHPAAVDFLNRDPSLYRIEVRGESWGAWAPNLSLMERLYDVAGIYNPLEVADYQLFWEGLTDRATPLYDFLNAKYIVAPKDFALPWDKFTPVFDGDPSVNVYLNTRALPRAQVIYRSRVIPDPAAAFAALRAPGFDPSSETILAAGDALNSAPTSETNLSFVEYEPQSIVVDVTAASDAYVVFSEVAYPGWTATVDGQPAPIERANFAFRAVRVPAGEHRVALSFDPPSWRLGLLMTVLSLVAYAALAIVFYRQRRM